MPPIFPRTFEIWQYSPIGKAMFWSELAVGIALAPILWRFRERLRIYDGAAASLAIIAILEHLAAYWALVADSTRGTGTLPIPQPFRAAGFASSLAFDLFGPLLAGLLIGRSVLVNRLRFLPRACLYACIAFYALFISPWAGVVIAD